MMDFFTWGEKMLIPDELFRAARFHNSAQYSEYAGPIPAASSYMGGFQSHSSAIVRARADDGLFYPGINFDDVQNIKNRRYFVIRRKPMTIREIFEENEYKELSEFASHSRSPEEGRAGTGV
jgi:hypothetical protein